MIEVFVNMKTEHFSQTDGHIRIPRKIEINLKRIGNNADPGRRRADVADAERKNFIGRLCHDVRDDNLLCQSLQKADGPLVKQRQGYLTFVNLAGNVVILQNRTGNQLREKRNKQSHFDNVLLRFANPAVYIDQV